MTFFIGGLNLQQAETSRHNMIFLNSTSGVVLQGGRQLLQVMKKEYVISACHDNMLCLCLL